MKDTHIAELRAAAVSRLPEPIARVVCSAAQPFLQVIYDVDAPRMAFGRVCLIGDAAFAVRPHAAAGSAKAAADAWALTEAIGVIVLSLKKMAVADRRPACSKAFRRYKSRAAGLFVSS
ncbi:FAD-dependent monooxygenase (plasmid) [Cupriavidus necator]|nr:FAD-dependent monooxygenase [Cupriavidus necator]